MLGFPRPFLYITISPQLLTVKNVRTGLVLAEVPEIAVTESDKPEIVGVGVKARAAAALKGAKVVNPFAHPRSLMSDFTMAEQLLKYQVRVALGNSLIRFAPIILIQPLGDPEGGLTQIERRALRELALGAGAVDVYLYVQEGEPLNDEQLQQIQKTVEAWPSNVSTLCRE